MAKKWLTLAACALLSCGVYAQKLEKSLLWKISGNGLNAPSYLYGTVHVSCEVNLDERVQRAMDDTQQLYLELDMDDAGLQMKMAQAMMMKDGTTLRKILPKHIQEQLDTLLKERTGLGLDMVNVMQPQAISMLLLPSFLNCEKPDAVENALMKISQEQGEEIFGLETVETQIAALNAKSIQEQADMLVEALSDGLEKMKTEIQKMNAFYAAQDIEGLYKFTTEHESMQGDEYAFKMLEERNRNWIPVIAKTAQEKPTFFGVGAAHLGGEIGVIQLLRKAGYKVEAVMK